MRSATLSNSYPLTPLRVLVARHARSLDVCWLFYAERALGCAYIVGSDARAALLWCVASWATAAHGGLAADGMRCAYIIGVSSAGRLLASSFRPSWLAAAAATTAEAALRGDALARALSRRRAVAGPKHGGARVEVAWSVSWHLFSSLTPEKSKKNSGPRSSNDTGGCHRGMGCAFVVCFEVPWWPRGQQAFTQRRACI